MLDPAMGVFALWIPVGPVDHPTLIVPFVLAVEVDGITHL